MSVYFIVEILEIFDTQKYREYIEKAPEIVEKFGGTYLVRNDKSTTILGDWNPLRLIIIKFDSMGNFQNWRNSPEYQLIAPLREQSAKSKAVVLEGI